MIIDSKFTKVFTSCDLTKKKYKEISRLAKELLEHKRLVSVEIADNLLFYTDLSKYNFITYLEHKYKDLNISSNFYKGIYKDIYTAYTNKFNKVKEKMSFKINKIENIERYKRNSKFGKKDGIKSINYSKKSTKLAKVLTYLVRYPNDNLINYLNGRINDVNIEDSKKNFFKSIIFYIEKYGYDRIIKLSILKRSNILDKYAKPIEFESLNFRGRTRTSSLISYNENKKSIKKAFVTLSWVTKGKPMIIPVSYSKEFYGNIEKYQKKSNDYEYILTFTRKGKININFTIDGTRELPENQGNKNNFVGVDVNVKNNLFTLSDETTYDYDGDLLNQICKELEEMDRVKGSFESKKYNNEKKYKCGKKRKRKISTLRNKLKHSTERLISNMCKDMLEKGFDHAIFEDLDNSFGKTFGKMNDINFNRITKELGLSSLKNIFERIARKYGIAFSKVHPEYTSKMCSQCKCIDDDNRKTQEEFECVSCGYKNNADVNAALNIRNRVVETVFLYLLKQDEHLKTYSPHKLKRGEIKKFFDSLFPVKKLSS